MKDAELSMALVERLLEWFFCFFPGGYRLTGITRDNTPLRMCGNEALNGLIEDLTQSETDRNKLSAVYRAYKTNESFFLDSPLFPAVLSEMLIEQNDRAELIP